MRRKLWGAVGAAALTAVAALTGCTPGPEPDVEPAPAATYALSAYGFQVEEIVDELVLPYGIAVGTEGVGYLVAGEPEDRYLVVWRVDGAGWTVVTAEEAGFDDPQHVAVGPDGRVYVANAGNDTVSIGDADGESWHVLAADSFSQPVAVAVGDDGVLAVANAGNGSVSVSADGGTTWEMFDRSQTGLQLPAAIEVTVDGTVVIVDAAADAVAIGRDGGREWTVAGPAAGFSEPLAVASGPDGTIYVASRGNGSLLSSSDGGQTWSTLSGFESLAAVAVGDDGSVYVTDGVSAAARLSTTPGAVRSLAAESQAAGTVVVSWEPPAADGGREVTGYAVSLYSPDGDADAADEADVGAGERAVTFDGVAPGVVVVAVYAVNDNGVGMIATHELVVQ